jgi:hypothetical protein
VAAEAQSGVRGAAARIVLHGNACGVVEGVLEPRITGEPLRDDAALAGALGNRSSATKSPQGVIVSSLEGFPSLGEQRGEEDPTVSWEGPEHRSVALLVCPPQFALRRLGHFRRGFPPGPQLVATPTKDRGARGSRSLPASVRLTNARFGPHGERYRGTLC